MNTETRYDFGDFELKYVCKLWYTSYYKMGH